MKTISIKWCTDDVTQRAAERGKALTEAQGDAILDLIERRHDCTIGVNWDTVDVMTDYYLDNEPLMLDTPQKAPERVQATTETISTLNYYCPDCGEHYQVDDSEGRFYDLTEGAPIDGTLLTCDKCNTSFVLES